MLKTIKQNDSGDIVNVAQYLTGYAFRNEADGKFNAYFVAYMSTWQRKNGITPDGIIGEKTWAKIAEKALTCSTAKNSISGATCALQILLDGINVDGIYGSKTKNAVAAFQSANGLKADGICGPKTWAALIVGDVANSKGFKQPINYKQYDSRWANKQYSAIGSSKQTMRSSGCGPTSAANVVATLKDKNVTPWTLAQIALKKGYRTKNDGTAWGFFKYIAAQYGFSKFIQTSSLATLKACLDAGGYAVASMGPDYWTSGGHYITPWKYEGTYIYCNDPASSKRTKQKETDFVKQRKQFFCFYP